MSVLLALLLCAGAASAAVLDGFAFVYGRERVREVGNSMTFSMLLI